MRFILTSKIQIHLYSTPAAKPKDGKASKLRAAVPLPEPDTARVSSKPSQEEVDREAPIYGNAPQSRFIKQEDLEDYVARVKAGTAGIADEFKVDTMHINFVLFLQKI